MSLLDLENVENWAIRDTQFFTTTSAVPLPEYTSGFDFSSSILAVLIDNSEARETWNFAGYISQRIILPFGPSASSNANSKRLWLRQKQLLIFLQLASTYKVSIRFPKWFDRASVTIWEYTGPQPEAVETQLDQMQGKLNTLLERPP